MKCDVPFRYFIKKYPLPLFVTPTSTANQWSALSGSHLSPPSRRRRRMPPPRHQTAPRPLSSVVSPERHPSRRCRYVNPVPSSPRLLQNFEQSCEIDAHFFSTSRSESHGPPHSADNHRVVALRSVSGIYSVSSASTRASLVGLDLILLLYPCKSWSLLLHPFEHQLGIAASVDFERT